ncbi:serine protease [Amycolatopsis antarctica]|uniref:Serine protease n=1 Tax=Amycolatopsis antarctica TaxID=1854586 RepID=A0A263DBX0_9PSEU|nr:S8 family serine peptidase [Amycolatopsis antarctica]OZM74997.1 serine protease [Amycolatopsis antarctica]
MTRTRRWLLPAATAIVLGATSLLATPAATAAPSAPAPAACDETSPAYSYVVLFQPRTKQKAVDREMAEKCGSTVSYFPEIGVAVAVSRNADFQQRVGPFRAYSGGKEVAEAPGTAAAGMRANARANGAADATLEQTTAVAASADLAAQQWDMRAIKAPEANKVNPGSGRVTVGVIDSGVEATHPALAHAIDAKSSAGCLSGKADTAAAAWAPTTSDHGTHVAGTIAGKDPATGFTGVVPGVKLASVKVVNDEGLIYPEAAVCAFMWSAERGFPVTNNSYYVDPGMFYCPKQPGDAAAYEAVRRSVAYSQHKGVLNVAAAGNSGFDIPAQTTDPNRPHAVDASCAILPKGLDGVVTTSAVGYAGTKSSYSNYGKNEIDVTAPGGDRAQLPPAGEGAGCPLSTVVNGAYGTKCGTSMASPHAAGVAALLASKYRFAPPRLLSTLLGLKADPVPCGGAEGCTGSDRYNSFYGKGMVNALRAVR